MFLLFLLFDENSVWNRAHYCCRGICFSFCASDLPYECYARRISYMDRLC